MPSPGYRSEGKVGGSEKKIQKGDKDEAVTKVVGDLIEENFVKEIKYTTWLSILVLVKI